MKFSNILFALLFAFVISSCGDDENEHEHDTEGIEYEYHAHINSPDESDKHLGDELTITVDFESHTGETVHHINVVLYQADDESVVIFNEPGDAHIHDTSGEYEFSKTITLDEATGIVEHTDYVLKATVWGSEEGDGEEVETITFHVHP